MKVRVYRNLHNDMWSVQYYNRQKKGWRLLAHMNEIYLTNVKFQVNETGRQKVLKEKRKNVHAFIEGNLRNLPNSVKQGIRDSVGFKVTYDPYKYKQFIVKFENNTHLGIFHAPNCYMNIENKEVLI
jgi:hypothetical protein